MRTLLLAATALAMLGGVAYAQNSASGSNSTTTVNTQSGSQSSSVSSPRVNVIGNPIGNGASSSTSGAKATANTRSSSRSAAVGNTTNVTISSLGGGGLDGGGGNSTAADPTGATSNSQYIGYGGSYTVRNTPEVIPPSVMGGNACAVGASAGMSLAGFGIAGGATWADKQCERRQQAALLFNMGEQKVALELMCQDDSIRSAMRIAGKPCVADLAAAQPAIQVAQAAPAAIKVAAVTPAPLAVTPAVAPLPAAARPDWCAKAAPTTEASRTYVAQVCGK